MLGPVIDNDDDGPHLDVFLGKRLRAALLKALLLADPQ